jgi:hypothetical protein
MATVAPHPAQDAVLKTLNRSSGSQRKSRKYTTRVRGGAFDTYQTAVFGLEDWSRRPKARPNPKSGFPGGQEDFLNRLAENHAAYAARSAGAGQFRRPGFF